MPGVLIARMIGKDRTLALSAKSINLRAPNVDEIFSLMIAPLTPSAVENKSFSNYIQTSASLLGELQSIWGLKSAENRVAGAQHRVLRGKR
jgi:hypothetical protein